MQKIIHKANERGSADYGWLTTKYSFSFSDYYNSEKVHFGLLRVLNDDTIQAGRGFGMHPHDNMEIVTIPLAGTLEHRDSKGNAGRVTKGEVQVMSAGTGIFHSEFASPEEEVRLFQIWVLPKEKNIDPRYAQKKFSVKERKNNFQTIVSPEKNNNALWFNQDAYFALGNFDKGTNTEYKIRVNGNGIYLFVIEGKIETAGETLNRRDAIGIWETESIKINSLENSELLLIEVPMKNFSV